MSLCVALSAPFYADATNYYVATDGSDSNPGTSGSPFLTIQKGVDVSAAGDTIIVKNGTYNCPGSLGSMAVNINKAGTSGSPITLKAENKWGAVLDGLLTCHSFINFQASSAWWVIQDLDITNTHDGGIWSNSDGAQNIVIKGNHIHHIGNRANSTSVGEVGIYTDASAIMTIDSNVINDVGRTDHTASNSFDHGIYSHGNLTIINNLFYRSLAGWHIQTAVDFQGTIANNTFVGPNMWDVSYQGQIMLWDVSGAITIRNNIFFSPTDHAIVTSSFSSTGCTIDHNLTSVSSIFRDSGCTVSNNLVNTDPLLVNSSLSAPDGNLQSGSPAINTGTTISSVTYDHNGVTRPQGAAYDMGAYEYLNSKIKRLLGRLRLLGRIRIH